MPGDPTRLSCVPSYQGNPKHTNGAAMVVVGKSVYCLPPQSIIFINLKALEVCIGRTVTRAIVLHLSVLRLVILPSFSNIEDKRHRRLYCFRRQHHTERPPWPFVGCHWRSSILLWWGMSKLKWKLCSSRRNRPDRPENNTL